HLSAVLLHRSSTAESGTPTAQIPRFFDIPCLHCRSGFPPKEKHLPTYGSMCEQTGRCRCSGTRNGNVADFRCRMLDANLSVWHSYAQSVETCECHQIVTKTGAKWPKIKQIQETEIVAILQLAKG